MKTYWLGDLKKNEKAIYIGHISAENRSYGIDEDIQNRINNIKKEIDMTGMRFSTLRDLSDEYPTRTGFYYGGDVWLIVKPGYFKKNQKTINEFKRSLKIKKRLGK